MIAGGLLEAGALLLANVNFWMPAMLPPRAGLIMLVLDRLIPIPLVRVFLTEGASACWLVTLGVLFVFGKRPLKTYVVSEILLSAPTLWLGISLVLTGGGHVFTMENGLSLLVVFTFLSAIPILWTIWIWKQNSLRKSVKP